ncbi:MAG: M20 family metallopeptidase [Nitrospinota bacterium]
MTQAIQKAVRAIDEKALARLGMEMTAIPSPTGEEGEMGRYLAEQFRRRGLRTQVQEVSEDRCNVVGRLEGTGEGITLMFNGHMDTSYSGREKELHGPGYKTRPVVRKSGGEEWIYGAGINNMKNALASYLGVVDALRKAKVRLKGDIVIAAVVGEIEKAPIDEFQGATYAGYGTGTKYLLSHGGIADFCIIGEPTGFVVTPGNMGSVWIQFTTYGTMAHAAWADRAVNAIDQMQKVIAAIRKWAPTYARRRAYQGVRPPVNIGAIEGGWRWRAVRVPVQCKLCVDVRLPPDVLPIEVFYELREVVRRLQARDADLEVDVEVYSSNPGTDVPADHPTVRALQKAHRAVFRRPPKVECSVYISDAVHLNRYGITTVNYGGGGRLRTGGCGFDPLEGEHQSVRDMARATEVYVRAAIDLCSKTRAQLGVRG